MDAEDLHLCGDAADTGDEREEKSNPVSCGLKQNEVSAVSTESGINPCQRLIPEEETIGVKEAGITLEHSNDFARVDSAEFENVDEEEHILQEKTHVEVAAGDFPSPGPESRDPPEDAAGMNTTGFLLDDGSWEHITNWAERDTESGMTQDLSESSTLSAASLNSGDANSLQSDFWIMERQMMELELRTDEINLVSCDSSSPGMEYIETADISMAPMESLHLSLVSNNNLLLGATGTGTSSFRSKAAAMTGTDWHMGSVPVKCLQLGAVNIVSLTLGTVGIGIIPMVSAGKIDVNPFTEAIGMAPIESLDWETVSIGSTTYAGHVNVDSITPEGVRERWHPLEDRLCALGEALTALDKKIEGFSPRLREAETLLNDMEGSLTQHAMHITDIMNENTALAQRILQLEERMREDA